MAVKGFDPAWCFDTPQMDGAFLWEREAGYFVQAFLNKYKGLKVQVEDLEPDFERLVAGALPAGLPFFLHRDYQSRNLFLKNGQLRVIDFQGARLGPVGYDLAALLIDPYVKLNRAQQGELLSHYLDLLRERISVNEAAFREQYYHLALSRNLQILGAFGFLTKVKGKTAFAQYIPAALASLQERLAERPEEFPRLAQAVKSLS
jgi:aminoglycoside/choline kinase family phosphotransferase